MIWWQWAHNEPEAIDALVGYWVDNDYKIEGYDDARPPVPILGLTDVRP